MKCSVVIPVYGSGRLAGQCVDAIHTARPQVDHEILVVDDGSPGGPDPALVSRSDLRLIPRDENGGFAAACNRGAREAAGELIVFLNDDTLPRPGWLDTLVERYEELGPAVLGARLLYPGGTIQHAGVVFARDGLPHHVYQGFRGDHPAVLVERRYQAVTAACMLTPRDLFLDLGGFDQEYRNGMEDVDFCLRLGQGGGAVWYCPDVVLTHLESVTRGRRTRDVREGTRRYRESWASIVVPDDLETYAADGLLSLEYGDSYPLRVRTSPELALVVEPEPDAVEHVLVERTRQATDLLRDLTELLARLGTTVPEPAPVSEWPAAFMQTACADRAPYPVAVTRQIEQTMEQVHRLQTLVAASSKDRSAGQAARNPASSLLPTTMLSYRARVSELRGLVERCLPAGSTVAVISRGDDLAVTLTGLVGWHFPMSDGGHFAGFYPETDAAAVAHLEAVRDRGADYLVIPEDCLWWLQHYAGLEAHLLDRYRTVSTGSAVQIFDLRSSKEAHVST